LIANSYNSRAVSILRYTAGIVDWRKDELQLDCKTRKLLTTYNMFHSKGDVDRLYLQRSDGRRGLISIEYCVLIEKACFYSYIFNSEEVLLRETLDENVIDRGEDKEAVMTSRKNLFQEKKRYSVFYKATEFRDPKSWDWLKKGDLKKATEETLMAAQEQAIRTRPNR